MSENRRDKVNKKIINSKFTKLLIFILLVAVICVIAVVVLHKDKLYGTWSTDGKTVYTFNGKGEGYLRTSVSKYNFSYKVKRNTVHIDFKVEKANDSDYEFSIKNNSLILKGIEKTAGKYTLKKQ